MLKSIIIKNQIKNNGLHNDNNKKIYLKQIGRNLSSKRNRTNAIVASKPCGLKATSEEEQNEREMEKFRSLRMERTKKDMSKLKKATIHALHR